MVLQTRIHELWLWNGFWMSSIYHNMLKSLSWHWHRRWRKILFKKHLFVVIAIQSSAIITWSNFEDIAYDTAIMAAGSESDIRITTDTPYIALTGELWGIYGENLRENWPRCNRTVFQTKFQLMRWRLVPYAICVQSRRHKVGDGWLQYGVAARCLLKSHIWLCHTSSWGAINGVCSR